MTAISIHELHEHTDLWVRKASEQEPVVVTDEGRSVAKIVPFPDQTRTEADGQGQEATPVDHPLARFAGVFKDDPLFDEWQQAMRDYRDAVEADPDAI